MKRSSHIRPKKQFTGCLIPYHFVRADEKNNTKNFNWLMNSGINEATYFVPKVKKKNLATESRLILIFDSLDSYEIGLVKVLTTVEHVKGNQKLLEGGKKIQVKIRRYSFLE